MRGSRVSTYQATYQDIHELLTGLGFSLEIRTPQRSVEVKPPRETLVYRHEKQGTVLKFPSKGNKPALQGEILSLRAHLVGNGHLTDEVLLGFLDRGAVRI
jgi:hypothetical protein